MTKEVFETKYCPYPYSTVIKLLLYNVTENVFLIKFSFTLNITTSKLTKTSHYTKKQQKLYDKIKQLKEVEKLSYRKISDKLEKLKYRSVRSGKILKPNYIFSIYKKGKIREERIKKKLLCILFFSLKVKYLNID